jgi:protein-S-isoprenylcysteine O-methyltransferase Ste14
VRGIIANPTYLVIALSWLAFLLYWSISGFKAGPRGKARNWAVSVLMIMAVCALFLLVRESGVSVGIDSERWHGSPALDIGADVLAVLGVSIMIWARRTLGSNWSGNVKFMPGQDLVQRGPYKRVRHPIYSGFFLMALGTAVAYGRLLGILILAVCSAGLWLKASREEILLARHFPGAYERYKARTKAFIPYVL